MVTDTPVFARFGRTRSCSSGRGLRRRLPAMLDGDERALRMVYSLAFSLPGTPVLFYGEEIGMAENLDDRGPLQPSARRCSGRPTAGSRPPSAAAADGRGRVRAGAGQRRHPAPRPDSLLNWFERLIRRRRECPELGFGTLTVLDDRAPTRCSPTAATGRARRSSPSTSSRASRSPWAAGRGRRGARRPVRGTRSTRSRRRSSSSPTPRAGTASRAHGVRLPP